MSKPLTIGITLATWQDNHILLRMMLNSLSKQTSKDFDVIIVDHFYAMRSTVVRNYAEEYGLEIYHMPFVPATHYAKRYMDMSVFQTAFVMSESERVCRMSEYRFLHPTFVQRVLDTPGNLDFYYHDLSTISNKVWNERSDEVDWQYVPHFPQQEVHNQPYPLNAYGNYCHVREEWLAINGFIDNLGPFHWEDQEFNARATKAGQRSSRLPNLMFRIWHNYPSNEQRATRPVLHPFKPICAKCKDTIDTMQRECSVYNDYDWGKRFLDRGENEVHWMSNQGMDWISCKSCGFTMPRMESGDVQGILLRNQQYRYSPINIFGAGRNMRILAEDLKGKSWIEKVLIHNESWNNPRYLVDDFKTT